MGEEKIKEFTDLNAWKECHDLVLLTYKLVKQFPASEKFGLISQMERASISVTSYIAEGFGRQTMKEKFQFYYLAHGSLTELKNQLIIAKDLGYTKHTDFIIIQNQLVTSQKLLLGLIRKTKSFIRF